MSAVFPVDPTNLTKLLVADLVPIQPGLSPSVPATVTKVGGVPVAACAEFQSTTGLVLLPRMTTAEIAALTPKVDGMMAFNSTLGTPQFIQSGGQISTVPNFGANPVISQRLLVNFTGAQINSVRNAPILLIEAVPNSTIIINAFYLRWNRSGANPTAGDNLSIQWGNAPNDGGAPAVSPKITLANFNAGLGATIYGGGSWFSDNVQSPDSESLGAPVYLTSGGAAQFDFPAGDAFSLYLDYEVIVGL